LRLCTICYSNCLPKDTVAMGSKTVVRRDVESKRSIHIHTFCGHHFCKDCTTQYLTHAIREGKSYDSLKCPEDGCGCIVSPVIVDKFCEKGVIELYNKVGFGKMRVSRCPFGRYCPHCNEFIERDKNSGRKVECKRCNKSFCARCSKPYHALTPCKDTASFKVWSTFKNVKRCPQCDFFIEKSGGCQHMQCGQCNYRFCWTCMRSQNECNSVFCQGNVMNHSLFGTSRPVRFVTRGVAGAVALPVVVAAGTIAGTAFVTFKGGELARKSYKSRKRRRKMKKARRAREEANRLTQGPPGSREIVIPTTTGGLVRVASPSKIRAATKRLGRTTSHATAARLTISVVVEAEISLVLLKRRLQELKTLVKNQLPELEKSQSSVGAKWIFVRDTFKKTLNNCREMYDKIVSKKIFNGVWTPQLTSKKKTTIKGLITDAFVAIGSLMLHLRNAFVELGTENDEALNPKTTYRYDRKSKTYHPIVKTDVSSHLPYIEELLPKFLGKAPQSKRASTLASDSAAPDRVMLMRHLLTESGLNPPVYIQRIFLNFYQNSKLNIEEDVLFWFKAIRHSIEGDRIEWLMTASWLYKIAMDTSEIFSRPLSEKGGDFPSISLTPSINIDPELSRNNARFCLGSICFHYENLVVQCQHGSEDAKIDLFEVSELVDEQPLLATASIFQNTLKWPFALGCILQYLASRHQTQTMRNMYIFHQEKVHKRKWAQYSSLFTEDDVLEVLHCALSIIYDSSQLPYLRSMCFYYASFVIHILNPAKILPNNKRNSAPPLINSDKAFICSISPEKMQTKKRSSALVAEESSMIEDIKVDITRRKRPLSWKLCIPQLTKACLAVMLHQSSSMMRRKTNDEAWLLPCACSCFVSIFENARSLTWHLTKPDGEETKKLSESGVSRRVTSQYSVNQNAERRARHVLLDLLRGLVPETQMRVLNEELKRLRNTQSLFTDGELWVIRRASSWIPKMYISQEWLEIERNGATYYVSLNGEIRATLPKNYLVTWKFTGGVQWFENNEWIKKTFPTLYPTYYARASDLLRQERLGLERGAVGEYDTDYTEFQDLNFFGIWSR